MTFTGLARTTASCRATIPWPNALANNTPTNFLGNIGSVNSAPPPETTGDYNGDGTVDAADYTVWRDTFGQEVDEGTGADGMSPTARSMTRTTPSGSRALATKSIHRAAEPHRSSCPSPP